MKDQIQTLIASAKNGDISAFERLYQRYENKVYTLTLSVLKNKQDAQDAAQQTFIQVYRKLSTLREDDAFEPWLLRIAVNKSRILLRGRREELSLDRLPEELSEAVQEEFYLPQEFAEREELIALVRKAIAELPALQREALILQLYHHMTIDEIAYVTQSNINTVKSRLYYSRRKIKEKLKEYADGLNGMALIPFSAVYLRALEEEIPKKRKHKNGWKQLQKQLEQEEESVDSRIAALLPAPHRSGIGAAVKIAAALLIGTTVITTCVAAVGNSENGAFHSRQRAADADRSATEPATRPADKPEQKPNRSVPAPQQTTQASTQAQQALPVQNDPLPEVRNAAANPNPDPQETLAPTAAPPQTPTAAPTQAPTAASPYAAAYSAYRELLNSSRERIEEYAKGQTGAVKPVAVMNLYGDDIPELLYLSRQPYYDTCELTIATYENGRVKTLNQTYSLPVDGGFCLFLTDSGLYSCISTENTDAAERCYYRYEDSSALDYHYNVLQDVLLLHRNYHDEWHYTSAASGEISAAEYAAAENALTSRVQRILFVQNADLLPAALRTAASSAMSIDEAEAFLTP